MPTDGAAEGLLGRGRTVAEVLAGCWRRSLPRLAVPTEQLWSVLPGLFAFGEASLVWRRLRSEGRRLGSMERIFRNEVRQQSVTDAVQEERTRQAIRAFRASGIDPILIKGWASARHYAAPGLRPYGDTDLCVRPDQFPAALTTLQGMPTDAATLIDLHCGVPDLPDRSWQTLHERSQLVPLADTEVRLLGAEDHLRLLCLHLTRHGGLRPLWLCDVAAAVESGGSDLDWDYCLSGNRQRTEWVGAILGLARALLTARLTELPQCAQPGQSWGWLMNAVLWQWGTGPLRQPASYYARRPGEVLRLVRYDWLNPLKAMFRLRLRPGQRFLASAAPILGATSRVVLGAARLGRLLSYRPLPPATTFEVHRDSIM